ncbi:MAG: CalY family protein [Actinobacteria bacterium]|jgi:hypothetical protein|nr:CalY family protein [Actinomycetota bacterium]
MDDDLLDELDALPARTPEDRDRRRRSITTVGIVALAFVGLGQLTTAALFEDTATAATSYASGNVAIEAGGQANLVLAAAANMAPGDTVYRHVSVSNAGSLDLRYAISAQTTSETKNLSQVLRYAVYNNAAGTCTKAGTASATPLVSNIQVAAAATPLVGSSVNGYQAGDREIPAGASADDICIAVTLPLATTSAYASADAQVTLSFDAEQTKNN